MSRPIARPVGADAPGADEHVGARPGAEVEHRLALVQVGHRGGDAAPQRGRHRGLRCTDGVLAGVEVGAEHLIGGRVGCSRRRHSLGRCAAASAAGGGVAVGHPQRGVGVARADVLAQLVIGQLSHVVNS